MTVEPVQPLDFTLRHSLYPSIDPLSNSKLSAAVKGKTVLITGGGRSIGAAIAECFAKASVANVCIIGRTQSALDSTAQHIRSTYQHVNVYALTFDLATSSPENCTALFTEIKTLTGASHVDVLVLNAGHLHEQSQLLSEDFLRDDFWQCYRVNVLGNLDLTRAFLRQQQPGTAADLTLIAITSFLAYLPPFGYAVSGYASSKAAWIKTLEYLHAEVPTLRLFNLHPGSVISDMFLKCGADPNSPLLQYDEPELCGGMCVWLCTPDADFLSGRTIEATWSVDSLLEHQEEIAADARCFRIGLEGRGEVSFLRADPI